MWKPWKPSTPNIRVRRQSVPSRRPACFCGERETPSPSAGGGLPLPTPLSLPPARFEAFCLFQRQNVRWRHSTVRPEASGKLCFFHEVTGRTEKGETPELTATAGATARRGVRQFHPSSPYDVLFLPQAASLPNEADVHSSGGQTDEGTMCHRIFSSSLIKRVGGRGGGRARGFPLSLKKAAPAVPQALRASTEQRASPGKTARQKKKRESRHVVPWDRKFM